MRISISRRLLLAPLLRHENTMTAAKSAFPFTGEKLKRYKDLALLFLKHGRDDFLKAPGASDHFKPGELDIQRGQAKELANDLEKMGPTFVKIGQLLSTRADLLQEPYLEALARLQDDVAEVPFEDIERIVHEELGVGISKAFANFERKPLASASLGQVHRATLRSGAEVVVKVQRPGIGQQVSDDLSAITSIAKFFHKHSEAGKQYGVLRMVEQFSKSILRELDYELEARNLTFFKESLERFPRLCVPGHIPDYSSSRVLTMDMIHGQTVTKLSGVVLNDINGTDLADELFHAYLYQILVLGSFHADPHPGNLLLTKDHQLALLDLGMVGHIGEETRENLAHFLIALSEKKGQLAAEYVIRIGRPQGSFDRAKFADSVSKLITETVDEDVRELKIGDLILTVTSLCASHGLILPDTIVMLGKTLLNLDIIGSTLSPGYNPATAIREKSSAILQEQETEHFSWGQLLSSGRDMRNLATEFPGKARQLMNLIAENKLKVEVDALDEKSLIASIQKIANRITAGLVIAALIVGAALIMQIDTRWQIFGYPGLALVLFVTAFLTGSILVWNILRNDA